MHIGLYLQSLNTAQNFSERNYKFFCEGNLWYKKFGLVWEKKMKIKYIGIVKTFIDLNDFFFPVRFIP